MPTNTSLKTALFSLFYDIHTLTFDQKMTAEQKHGQSLAQFSEQKLAGHPAPQKGLQTQ